MHYFANAAQEERLPNRRSEHNLREIFDRAYEVLSPFMNPKNSWGGQFTARLAFRAIRDRIPELPAEAARILIAASMKRGSGLHNGSDAAVTGHSEPAGVGNGA